MTRLTRRLEIGNWQQKLRLWSGLALFAFCLSHFTNHALGIISIEAMDRGSVYHYALWHNTAGLAFLGLAAFTHMSLALYKASTRRTFKMPAWEFLQLALGLYIPWTLIPHVVATLGLYNAHDLAPTYQRLLAQLWPQGAIMQSVLLLVVWTHAMTGLHFWLRIYRVYRKLRAPALSFAVGFPLLALWGWIEGARRHAANDAYTLPVTQAHVDWLYTTSGQIRAIVYGLIICSLVVVVFRLISDALQRRIKVTYPGNKVVQTVPGPSLLEISRMSGIPHAAVCGGRARCSTCRIKVTGGADALPVPGSAEQAVLQRIGADETIRLACQIRPQADLEVQPLVPAQARDVERTGGGDAYYWGVEQAVTIMFVDLRNFTGITEKNLSYDVVFLLNRYLSGVSDVISAEGGYVDKFIGDGVMAIFGMQTGAQTGARQALRAAIRIRKVQDDINAGRGPQFPDPFRLGVGLHAGTAILGRIGAAGSGNHKSAITALGDAVNTASRLETENKAHGAFLTASDDVFKTADMGGPDFPAFEITLRGKSKPLKFYSFEDIEDLAIPA
ncbi:adenylate/guanylate cyclase domain-containing protein [Roseibium sp. RKSG952]|nr:adenylate/guanylate cyclase domain-containing protein [Roseibium sp. RKSG952]